MSLRDNFMLEKDIPDYNIFMICEKLNKEAFRKDLPKGYYIRNCRKDEYDIWKKFPFNDEKLAKEYNAFMEDYFDKHYKSKEDLFFKTCKFICDEEDTPITKREFCYQVRDSKKNEMLCIASQGIIGRGNDCNSCKDTGLYANIESIDGELDNFLAEQLRKNPESVAKIDECSDTDKGLNLYEFGLVYAGEMILHDNCINDKILEEKWCFKDSDGSSYYYGGLRKECGGTCLDDRCVLLK